MINVSDQIIAKVTKPSIDMIWSRYYNYDATIRDQIWRELYAKVLDKISPLKIYDLYWR